VEQTLAAAAVQEDIEQIILNQLQEVYLCLHKNIRLVLALAE
jgi:hypothetical protein